MECTHRKSERSLGARAQREETGTDTRTWTTQGRRPGTLRRIRPHPDPRVLFLGLERKKGRLDSSSRVRPRLGRVGRDVRRTRGVNGKRTPWGGVRAGSGSSGRFSVLVRGLELFPSTVLVSQGNTGVSCRAWAGSCLPGTVGGRTNRLNPRLPQRLPFVIPLKSYKD